MRKGLVVFFLLAILHTQSAYGIMESGGYPWDVKLRSWHDQVMRETCPDGDWFLNLGPTGIRACIYSKTPNLLVVKYVFQDDQSPARGKVKIDDVIAGANGQRFKTSHRFGRRLPDGGGWDGPMMELAGHIEDSQGKDGVLKLMVWPKGDSKKECVVEIKLKPVGRFSKTFPYDCPRSNKMLEELCDFLVADYHSGNWKKPNMFYGDAHGQAHQVLALMASGIPKYEPLIQKIMQGYRNKKYNAEGGGFQTWDWGFDGILMGEYYLLYKDEGLKPAMRSLAETFPLGCHNGNGIYTHTPFINITARGGKPYASIAAISGLAMISMSLFKAANLPYDQPLYERIHQHYLNSTSPEAVNIAYGFGNADRFNPEDIRTRHAIIKLKDLTKGLSGKGPGYVCPSGMKGIGEYEIVWPTKADPRWKPTEWVAKEAGTNILTELTGASRRVDRNHPNWKEAPEPTGPYNTTRSGGHLAPAGMGALAHLIGNKDNKTWTYLGLHAANTCVLGPNNAFDGHASSNLAAFWSILGAARSDRPAELRAYLDYMKTFLILSETHDGGLILQPWGRDRPYCNSDRAYGPRILPTATGAILLALAKKRLQITGAPTREGKTGSPLIAVKTEGATRVEEKNPTTPDTVTAATTTSKDETAAPAAPRTAITADVLAQWQARFAKKLDASARSGMALRVNVSGQDYRVLGADESKVIMGLQGSQLPMPWSWLSPDHRLELANAMATDADVEALLIAAVFQLNAGGNEKAEILFARATLKDAAAARAARDSLNH